jgi:hypothetical protein
MMNDLAHAGTRLLRSWLLLGLVLGTACNEQVDHGEVCDCIDRPEDDAGEPVDARSPTDARRDAAPAADARAPADAGETRVDGARPATEAGSDAASAAGSDAALGRDAAPNGDAGELACTAHEQCGLYQTECCPCEPPSGTGKRVPGLVARPPLAAECSQVQCEVCIQPETGPLDPRWTAGCMQNQCAIVDVRKHDVSRCTTDADCRIEDGTYCDPCTNRPDRWFGVRKGADLSLLMRAPSAPIGACLPCVNPEPLPVAFCAADGHCAVRSAEQP